MSHPEEVVKSLLQFNPRLQRVAGFLFRFNPAPFPGGLFQFVTIHPMFHVGVSPLSAASSFCWALHCSHVQLPVLRIQNVSDSIVQQACKESC